MPEAPGNRQIVAVVMMFSAVSLAVVAYLMYAGIIPLPEEMRFVAAVVAGAVAFMDFVVGLWFFRMGQSS